MMKYEKPRLVDIEINKTEGNPGGCENGSVNTETCGGGGTVIASCHTGGLPIAKKG